MAESPISASGHVTEITTHFFDNQTLQEKGAWNLTCTVRKNGGASDGDDLVPGKDKGQEHGET